MSRDYPPILLQGLATLSTLASPRLLHGAVRHPSLLLHFEAWESLPSSTAAETLVPFVCWSLLHSGCTH